MIGQSAGGGILQIQFRALGMGLGNGCLAIENGLYNRVRLLIGNLAVGNDRRLDAHGDDVGILSAVSGFIIGAYIPISQFSGRVQTVCNLFPASHITILLRNALLNGVLGHIDGSIGGLDGGAFTQTIRDAFTFRASMFGTALDPSGMLIYVAALLVLSVSVMICIYSRNYQRK